MIRYRRSLYPVSYTHLRAHETDSYLVGLGMGVMIKRNSWGHSYFIVRGEILGFMKDELLRKHLPRMFSLIKNESWGLEDD